MRAETGVSVRRWVAFRQESFSSRNSWINDEVDPRVHPFGRLELGPESGVAGRALINELLRLIRARRLGPVCDALGQVCAQLEMTRCVSVEDLAVHEIAAAIADFALGEHHGLRERIERARGFHDDAFTKAGAMMIALGMGELASARELADDALAHAPPDARVLRQAAQVYQYTLDFRAAIAAYATLFDLADIAGASRRARYQIVRELEVLGGAALYADEHDLDMPRLIRRVELAVALARDEGYPVRSVELVEDLLAIEIDAPEGVALALSRRIAGTLRACGAPHADALLTIAYRSPDDPDMTRAPMFQSASSHL
jgi:tetratricopeptide (TPR) repeat protein